MKRTSFFINLIAISIFICVSGAYGQSGARSDYKQFLKQYLEKLNYSSDEIQLILNDSRLKFHSEFFKVGPPKTKEQLQKIKKQFEKDFFSEESIKNGKKFIDDNLNVLDSAEDKYGVPKEIIIAIIRIESNFGQFEGKYYIVNALATMAYQQNLIGKSRIDWKKELRIFLAICKNNEIGIFDYKGSRAGCFGLVQFLPSSYESFAVDGNGDTKVDLFNIEGAVYSASNYLYEMGWRGDNFKKILG